MPVNLILNIMLGKLQNCNKGTRVPEVTSVTVYNSKQYTVVIMQYAISMQAMLSQKNEICNL